MPVIQHFFIQCHQINGTAVQDIGLQPHLLPGCCPSFNAPTVIVQQAINIALIMVMGTVDKHIAQQGGKISHIGFQDSRGKRLALIGPKRYI